MVRSAIDARNDRLIWFVCTIPISPLSPTESHPPWSRRSDLRRPQFTRRLWWTRESLSAGHQNHSQDTESLRRGLRGPIRLCPNNVHVLASKCNSWVYPPISVSTVGCWQIPAFGFGDIYTKGTGCFPFFPDRACCGLDEVLTRYNQIVGGVELSGPTNFAPAIRKAVEIVRAHSSFHLLLIIADGQVRGSGRGRGGCWGGGGRRGCWGQ